ncbi:MAG: hypothetical protein Q4G36_06245 [Paracoccus sp. (in: a-proteobacteria)]|nr:hypothetical protein [Paracoccus sp. (in: a-proteobacteria)]
MRDFARLLEQLAFTPQRLGKERHLARFFAGPARPLHLAGYEDEPDA